MVIAERPEIIQIDRSSKAEDLSRPVPEILGEEVLHKQGSFSRVRRYLRGWHPKLGVLSEGLQGRETIVEEDIIKPIGVFRVLEASSADHFSNGSIAVDKIGVVGVR